MSIIFKAGLNLLCVKSHRNGRACDQRFKDFDQELRPFVRKIGFQATIPSFMDSA
jgi:hypothetical protein